MMANTAKWSHIQSWPFSTSGSCSNFKVQHTLYRFEYIIVKFYNFLFNISHLLQFHSSFSFAGAALIFHCPGPEPHNNDWAEVPVYSCAVQVWNGRWFWPRTTRWWPRTLEPTLFYPAQSIWSTDLEWYVLYRKLSFFLSWPQSGRNWLAMTPN
jgi:hypothetical protein